MIMKKSRLYSVLSLALISGMLASCGESALKIERPFKHIAQVGAVSAKTGEPDVKKEEDGEIIYINDPSEDPKVIGVQSISIDRPVVSLYYSSSKKTYESTQLTAQYLPLTAKASAFKWSSDHPEIAKVDEKTGLVTAVSEGIATVSVTSEDGFVAHSHVVVNNTNILPSKADKASAKILAKQASLEYSQELFVTENYSGVIQVGEDIVEKTAFTQKMWASKKDAYFRITSDEQEVKCVGGSIVLDKVDYIFYTANDYYTYVFSTTPIKRNYMIIDQSSLVSTKTRYEAMCLVLNSFFTSGSRIITRQFDDLFSSDDLNPHSYAGSAAYGTLGEDSAQFAYRKISKAGGKVGVDDAEDMDIPVGTYVEIEDNINLLWENNLVSNKSILETISYEKDGKDAKQIFSVDYFFETEGVEFLRPNRDDYTQVADIFSL